MTIGRIPLALAAAVLFTTAACGGSSDAADAGSGGALTVKLGAVPTIDYGVIKVGETQGFFERHRVKVEITNLDSGPNVVTGVVAGQYDVGWTAYAPVLLAVAAGNAKLKLVSNSGVNGDKGTNGGLLTRRDSGITDFAGLAGKKVATNAPRSLLTLTTQAVVDAAGGDPAGIEFVTLPFNQIGKAVAEKKVDAGVTLQPYQAQALKQYPDLTDIGDTIFAALPPKAPGGALFAKKDLTGDRKTAVESFAAAYRESLEYADKHQDEVKAAGAPLAGLTPQDAALLPDADYRGTVTAADLRPLVELMKKYGWVKQDVDLASFVG